MFMFFFCNSQLQAMHVRIVKKKLQDILLITFNLKSKRVFVYAKCIEKVVPMCGNENHFQATFL